MRRNIPRTSIPRREFLKRSGMATLAAGAAMGSASPQSRPTVQDTFGLLKAGKKIPVILDMDIGDDIDDTWALTMMMKSPELDVKLVASDGGNDLYRARIIGKMLEVGGRADVPIGVGRSAEDNRGRQSDWLGDYDLAKYPGKVHRDGVDAIIRTIHASKDPMTLVCIGPVPNIAEALRRDPTIAGKARFVGMHGSVRRGYDNSPRIVAEYNVRRDAKALQKVFAAPWEVSITPLDTCGIVKLRGEKFRKVHQCKDPMTRALMANYDVWRKDRSKPMTASSILFDTVAVYMTYAESLLGMETLGLRVTDDGRTLIDEQARPVRCATSWKDYDGFEDTLVARLTG